MDNNQIPNTQPVETPVVVEPAAAPVQPAYNAQPTYATQPAYAQPAGQVVNNGGSKVLSIVAMICGICAMVFFWCPFLGLICGVAAIILAAIARKKGGNGMNKTGLILGIIGTVLGAIFTITTVAACAEAQSYYSYNYDYYYTVFTNNFLK